MYPIVKLRPNKETSANYRHPWLFSGAIETVPEGLAHGALVAVVDTAGHLVGVGTYSAKSSIAVRLFEFGTADIDAAWFRRRFEEAEAKRRLLGYGPGLATDGYRLVFGETDGLPGLVVDRYGDVLVLQSSTAGMDALLPTAVEALVAAFAPRAVVERSDLPVRREEGLDEVVSVRHGADPGRVAFSENGCHFLADVLAGQKTGFFLDQKDLRAAIAKLAAGRRVLNLFAYTGAASIAALKGGAASAHNVDSSEPALALGREQAALNGFSPDVFTSEAADIFQFLGAAGESSYDLVIMDPPALIKTRGSAEEGKKAYHFLNRAALRLVRDGGLFVTSSCSHFLPEEDLAFTLRRASLQVGVRLSVLGVMRQSSDHPQSVYFPEAAYLKSFICHVRR